jgi:hypothetical protein
MPVKNTTISEYVKSVVFPDVQVKRHRAIRQPMQFLQQRIRFYPETTIAGRMSTGHAGVPMGD